MDMCHFRAVCMYIARIGGNFAWGSNVIESSFSDSTR